MPEARFDSRCASCDQPILTGDAIHRDFADEEWICQECFDDEQLAIEQRELADGFPDDA